MHIILGVLGAIVSILVLVKRLSDAGIDFTWLNPFAWHRRRTWRKKYNASLVFSLFEPLEAAAMLTTTIAKIDGDLSREEKATLLGLFQSEFGKTEKEASDLLMSSIYIFGDGHDAISKPEKVLKASIEKFSEEQARSVVSMLTSIAEIDASNAIEKEAFLKKVVKTFDAHFNVDEKW